MEAPAQKNVIELRISLGVGCYYLRSKKIYSESSEVLQAAISAKKEVKNLRKD